LTGYFKTHSIVTFISLKKEKNMKPIEQANSHLVTIEQRVEDLLSKLTLKEKVLLLSGKDSWRTATIERLGIPSLTMTDGPHGVRSNQPDTGRVVSPATSFPTAISMAASWNPELIERVGAALGEEARAMGCDILLGPCVNIVRVPLAGRNFECYSEDPYLAGRIGVAYVIGVQSRKVSVSVKHYACNNQETERFRGSSEVDERTLREIYLPQFETIVKEAKPWTVMCSYNRINGVYASENNYILNEILKGEWGFDGVVVSDWNANRTTVASVKGGLDIEMPGPAKYYGNLLVEAVLNWKVDETVLDHAVRRILRLIIRSGRLDDPALLPSGSLNTPEHQTLARELAEASITLLKNENRILPLNLETIRSIAVIGPNAVDMRISGGGSANLDAPYQLSPLEGLKAKLGYRVQIGYEQGCDNFVEPPLIKSAYLTPAKGSGKGLWGEYFDNPDLSGKPVLERIDEKLRMWWFHVGPTEQIQGAFSVRWTGKLTVSGTGLHTFVLISSGKSRLYLDDQLLIENIATQILKETHFTRNTVAIDLVGGRSYSLRVELIKSAMEDVAHIKLLFGATPRPEEDDRMTRAIELAKQSEVAIVFAGMPEELETEGHDRPHLELPGRQTELIKAVAKANRNTIVVLNCAAPVTMPWLEDVPAVINMFYPGLEGGHAIARILVGEVNPSGKLSVTFPKRLEETPAFTDYPGTKEVFYGEGIFVGYRYYDKRDIEPLFPFGFGLSYTTFEYSQLKVSDQVKLGEPVRVSVTVKNTGQVAGKEVVQLYVHDTKSSLTRPPKELKGFEKLLLQPDESKTVNFILDQRALSFYDPYQKQWVAEPGEFEILIGSSSRDIRLKATFNLV
jgi:beta-glucosidase